MKRTKLLLKVITAANGEPVTPVQLQKVAFYVWKKYPDRLPEDFYNFRKYDYGPFSAEVYHDAEKLEHDGLVSIVLNQRGGWREYAATAQGLKSDLSDIPPDVSKFVEEKVRWARGLTFQELVRAVYKDFPQYRRNSVFQS